MIVGFAGAVVVAVVGGGAEDSDVNIEGRPGRRAVVRGR